MIIVEGPDGAGKSMLIKRLRNEFGYELPDGPKASTSLEGTTHHRHNQLADWVDAEMNHWVEVDYGPRFYDRHPLISEPIYGAILRDKLPEKFLTPWYSARLRQFRKMCLVVFVDPGWNEVRAGVRAEPQMDNVVDQAHRLWLAYRTLSLTWSGGAHTTYDRNEPRSLMRLIGMVDQHIKNWPF